MTEENKPAEQKPVDTSATARASIAKMTPQQIREIHSLIQYTVDEEDFPRFRAGLFKLGYDESHADYEKLVHLWDDCMRASRHP